MSVKTTSPLDKYKNLPEKYPAELIGGEIVMIPSPSYYHQLTAIDIASKMKNFVDENDLGVALYEFDVHLDDENVVRPDIIYISSERENIIRDNWAEGAPDIVVEILSPSTIVRDTLIKKDLYEKYGVKEYWIIDPNEKEIYVYENKDGKFTLICNGNKCSSKILNGFSWGFEK